MNLCLFFFYLDIVMVFVSFYVLKLYRSGKFFLDPWKNAQRDGKRLVVRTKKDGTLEFDTATVEGDYLVVKGTKEFIQSHDVKDEATEEHKKKHPLKEGFIRKKAVPMSWNLRGATTTFYPEGKVTPFNPFEGVEATMDQTTIANILDRESIRLDKKSKALPGKKFDFDIPIGNIITLILIIIIGLALWKALPMIMNLTGGLLGG